MFLRLIVLAGYVAAFVALRTYLRDRPPRFEGRYIYPYQRLREALVRMWGLLLWPLPGLIWIGIKTMPVSILVIISLSILIPLDIFLVFFAATGVLDPPSRPMGNRLSSWMPAVLSISLTLLIFLALAYYGFPLWQFTVFMAFVTIPPALAVILVVWIAPSLIPTTSDQPKQVLQKLRHFTGFFTTFPKPSWAVEDGEIKTRIKGNPFFGVGPGWLMTEPENLAVIKGGTDIKRIVGPGVLFTRRTESPYQVIDLRNQIRLTRIDARTKDGIEVNLPISSLFRIDPGHRTITLEGLENQEPWPYRYQRDIYQIVFAEEVDPTGKTPLEAYQVRPWDDIPLKAAINRVKQVIPEYSLEQLYSIDPETADINPETGKIIPETGDLTRTKIAKAVRENVRVAVEPLGFQILGGGMGNKITPTDPNVVKQRVETWKASLISKIMDWETDVKIQNLKDFSRIRSDARVKLLSQILEQTSMKLESADNASRYVAYHLLENLLHLARNSQVRELLPENALPTLTQLQQLTKEG
jgi:hypothetical protein